MNPIVFAPSAIWPLAIGFFGLGTGYLIWGGSALFRWPVPSPEVDRSIGAWGIAMNGFMQFLTGVYLMVGLTWFGVFVTARPLYMAAVAFTAYGVHWFVLGYRRMTAASAQPEAWMAIAFFLLSFLGMLVFFEAGDVPVGILFIGLTLIYATEVPTDFGILPGGGRIVGLWQFLTGVWLMYLTYAAVFNFSLDRHWFL